MGKSKKIAEEIVRRVRFYSNTDYITVRLGNIIGSRGSASEIFKRQIALGYPVTLTDNKMKRFFMTLQDAVKLIFLATQTGQDGNLFIPDLQAVYVNDFIKTLIRNLKPYDGHNIEIKIIGIRKGEKTDEELMTAEELNSAKYYEGYYLVDTNNRLFDIDELLDSFRIYDCNEFDNILRILKFEKRIVKLEEVQS
jgi:FlaA1/EpsC-like NDP-sugar epimerase